MKFPKVNLADFNDCLNENLFFSVRSAAFMSIERKNAFTNKKIRAFKIKKTYWKIIFGGFFNGLKINKYKTRYWKMKRNIILGFLK